MRYLHCFDDLVPLGIVPLTGEACGLGYRILCDVTAAGGRIVAKCLGVEVCFAEAWNRGGDDDPHIGSIMLAHEMLLPIAVFALLESGCTEVWRIRDGIVGIERQDARVEIDRLLSVHPPARRFSYRGTAGDRNVHAMSGRIT